MDCIFYRNAIPGRMAFGFLDEPESEFCELFDSYDCDRFCDRCPFATEHQKDIQKTMKKYKK